MELLNIDKLVKKKKILIPIAGILALVISMVVWFGYQNTAQDVSDENLFIGGDGMTGSVEDNSDDSVDHCDVYVDIGGAVEEPDVYCVDAGEILGNVIELAGGLKDGVCSRWVGRQLNMAAVVEPNSKIYIPFDDDQECLALEANLEEDASGASTGNVADIGKISINNASQADLESLSGVGPSTAQKIINGRPYGKLEDLMNVSGIGQATYDKLKDGICL